MFNQHDKSVNLTGLPCCPGKACHFKIFHTQTAEDGLVSKNTLTLKMVLTMSKEDKKIWWRADSTREHIIFDFLHWDMQTCGRNKEEKTISFFQGCNNGSTRISDLARILRQMPFLTTLPIYTRPWDRHLGGTGTRNTNPGIHLRTTLPLSWATEDQ